MNYYKDYENIEIPVYRMPKKRTKEKTVFLDSNRISKITVTPKKGYAAMAIKKSWKNSKGQQGSKTLAFVVAPCYVINSKKEYRTMDATEPSMTYDVVFTWSQDGKENIQPKYQEKTCVNSYPAQEVFSTASDCQRYVNKLNEKLFNSRTQNLFEDEKKAVAAVFRKNEQLCRNIAFKYLSQKDILDIHNDSLKENS